jgi:serine/threonine protein phosphatase PrpC
MHPRKNVLAQALGAGHRYLVPHVGVLDYDPGDRFVLCSDGVIDGLWDRGIEDIARGTAVGLSQGSMSQRSKAEQLVGTAVDESGRDNATAVIVEAA